MGASTEVITGSSTASEVCAFSVAGTVAAGSPLPEAPLFFPVHAVREHAVMIIVIERVQNLFFIFTSQFSLENPNDKIHPG